MGSWFSFTKLCSRHRGGGVEVPITACVCAGWPAELIRRDFSTFLKDDTGYDIIEGNKEERYTNCEGSLLML